MAINLTDRAAVAALDPGGMWGLFEAFPEQCRTALSLSRQVDAPTLSTQPKVVALTGMGGSAAGGDFVKALFDEAGTVPFVVSRDYTIPAFIGKGDVVIVCSYSGETEETLSSYALAKAAGAVIIAVTSGGKLKAQALADGFTVVTVPGGQPPRSALGYMLIPAVDMVSRLGLIPPQDFDGAFALIEKKGAEWTIEGDDAGPRELATAIHGGLPLIYGLGGWEGLIANRWRGQINENAKYLAYYNVFPELCHNEIVGWTQAQDQGIAKFVVTLLHDGTASAKMQTRYEVTRGIIGDKAEFHEVKALGDTLLAKLLSLTFYGDFVSLYLSALNGANPKTIASIDQLKAELAKIA